MNLRAVAQQRAQVGRAGHGQLDILGEGLTDDFGDFRQQVRRFDRHPFPVNAPSESKDLLDDFGPAFDAQFDASDGLFPLLRQDVPAQVTGGHENGRQDVIEVVGHAGGQGADALDALGAQELGLELFLFGDVGVNDKDGAGLAVLVPQEGPTAGNRHFLAAVGVFAQFAGPLAVGQQGLLGGRQRRFVLFGKKGGHLIADGARGAPAIEAFGSFVPETDFAAEVLHQNGVAGQIQQSGLFSNPVLGHFALRDVVGQGQFDLAARKADHPGDNFGKNRGAVLLAMTDHQPGKRGAGFFS